MFRVFAYLRMALLSLYLNRLRALLSILGIVFGVMAVIVIIAVGEGAKDEALRQIEQLGTRNVYIRSYDITAEKASVALQNNRFGLSLDDLDRIQSGCKRVNDTAALKALNLAVIGTPKEITPQVVAVTASYGRLLDLKINQGRFISPGDLDRFNEVCVIGHDISMALGRDGRVGGILRIEDHLFKIIGVLESYKTDDNKTGAISARNYNEMILLPLGMGRWLERNSRRPFQSGRGHLPDPGYLTELIVQMDTPENVLGSALVIQRIMETIHRDIQDYQIIAPLELLNQTRKTEQMFSLFLITIASISLLVGGIGIMNIMLATVSERKNEIGIRRAAGANKGHILVQFLAESSILTLAGGIIGIGLGMAAMSVLSLFIPWASTITVKAIVIPLIISSLTGLFSGLYPAYSAANMDPIMALRN